MRGRKRLDRTEWEKAADTDELMGKTGSGRIGLLRTADLTRVAAADAANVSDGKLRSMSEISR